MHKCAQLYAYLVLVSDSLSVKHSMKLGENRLTNLMMMLYKFKSKGRTMPTVLLWIKMQIMRGQPLHCEHWATLSTLGMCLFCEWMGNAHCIET